MDSYELQQLAKRTRLMRETGIALLIGSGLLALFLLVPVGPKAAPVALAIETPSGPDAFATVSVEAEAAIVYDLATKKALYEKNSDAQLPLASLTKLLTVYASLIVLSPETPITIPAFATKLDMPRAFNEDQVFTLSDLARVTLTASLNDGAAAIAEATAQREQLSQNEMLASAAAALGLDQTYAVNGSGLDENAVLSGAYGSARNLAVLAGALLDLAPTIAEATTKSTAEATSQGGTTYTVKNTDPVIDTVPHILLSKTGYTDLANGNLVLVFDVGLEHPVAVVVLGSSKTARFTDGTTLVAATLAHFADRASL